MRSANLTELENTADDMITDSNTKRRRVSGSPDIIPLN
jgi:hypothetical protein